MFREMRRKKQELPMEEVKEILYEGTSGVLALSGDDGYPYAVPEGRFIFIVQKPDTSWMLLKGTRRHPFALLAKTRSFRKNIRLTFEA